MSDNDDNNAWRWSLTDQPFVYVVFPLVCIFIVGFVGSIIFTRYRRRQRALQNGNWPRDQANGTAAMAQTNRRGMWNRAAPWGGTRSQEGLNELGEAPPPYDPKRDAASTVSYHEMRDLEAGQRPPEYPVEPGPAVVR